MKRIFLVSLLLVCMVAPGTMAADLALSGVITQTLATAPDNAANAWGFAKSRLQLELKNENGISGTVITKVGDVPDGFAIDYAWVDAPLTIGGTLRFGYQRLGIANYGGGIFRTNTFVGQTVLQGNGVSYFTEIDNYKVKLSQIGGFGTRKIGAQVQTTIEDTEVGANVIYVTGKVSGETQSGFAVEVEGKRAFGPLTLSAQYYMDINDDAGILLKSATEKQAFLGAYAEYQYGYGKLYADIVAGMNEYTRSNWNESETKVGVSYDMAPGAALYLEQTLTDQLGGGVKPSVFIGIEAVL